MTHWNGKKVEFFFFWLFLTYFLSEVHENKEQSKCEKMGEQMLIGVL